MLPYWKPSMCNTYTDELLFRWQKRTVKLSVWTLEIPHLKKTVALNRCMHPPLTLTQNPVSTWQEQLCPAAEDFISLKHLFTNNCSFWNIRQANLFTFALTHTHHELRQKKAKWTNYNKQHEVLHSRTETARPRLSKHKSGFMGSHKWPAAMSVKY